jgi:peptidoglycan/LPS O-acetylase OafA/YrhL
MSLDLLFPKHFYAKMKKTILLLVIALMVVVTLIIWIANAEGSFDFVAILMIIIPAVVLTYAAIMLVRGISDAKNRLPAQDELTKLIMQRTGATAFQLSLFLWLVIGGMEDRIPLEGQTLINAGILGMAILFSLSWVYHRYIRRTHD